MGAPYAGRHRSPGRHRAPTRASRRRPGAAGPVTRAAFVGRPMFSAGAAVAVLASSAVGYARAGDMTSSASTFTVSAAAVSQATERTNEQLEQKDYQVRAADAFGSRQAVALDVGQKAQALEAARIDAERRAAGERAAREAQRQSIISNAQQDPQAVARLLLADFGWNDGQMGCLTRLWVGESNWNYKATNSSSGAYGIPQALPGDKMASVAADWRTNPVTQITWGLTYIRDVYGTPCGALARWSARSPRWY